MDRRVFLRGLAFLSPIDDDTWPPPARGGTSEVILRGGSCCFHLGDKLCFFSAEPGQDATEMPFDMALVNTIRLPVKMPVSPGASGSSTEDDGPPPEEVRAQGQTSACLAARLMRSGRDDAVQVVALFFRIATDVYLVNHTAIESCICPSDPRQVPPEDQVRQDRPFPYYDGLHKTPDRFPSAAVWLAGPAIRLLLIPERNAALLDGAALTIPD